MGLFQPHLWSECLLILAKSAGDASVAGMDRLRKSGKLFGEPC